MCSGASGMVQQLKREHDAEEEARAERPQQHGEDLAAPVPLDLRVHAVRLKPNLRPIPIVVVIADQRRHANIVARLDAPRIAHDRLLPVHGLPLFRYTRRTATPQFGQTYSSGSSGRFKAYSIRSATVAM